MPLFIKKYFLKRDEDQMLGKQDMMIEKQDETVRILKSDVDEMREFGTETQHNFALFTFAPVFLMLIFLFTAFTFSVPVFAQQATTVSIGSASAMHGGSVTLPIMVNYVTNLGSGTIDVSYNASIVHVTTVTDGTGNALEVQDWNVDNNIGIVRIVAWDASEAHSGNVIFANVTFKAIGSKGSTPLGISVNDLEDYYNYTQIAHNVTNGTFTIKPSAEQLTPTPTPSLGGGGGGGGGYVPTTPTPTEKQTAVEGVAVTPALTTPAPTITPPATAPIPAPTPAPVPGLPPLFLILIVTAVIVIAGIIIIVLRRK